MTYPTFIGARYLRSRKKSSISAIAIIAIVGVALGVAALLVVISISSGFQDEFTKKVLGVHAHIIITKYGRFSEYRDVIKMTEELPEVRGVAPFVIQEMMISHGKHTAGVALKGVDPHRFADVLDLPSQIVEGGFEGLRVPGSKPPKLPRSSHKSAPLIEQVEKTFAEPDAGSDGGPTATVESPKKDTVATKPEHAQSPDGTLPGIILGATLAENLKAKVGDKVQLTSPLISLDIIRWSPSEDTPRSLTFRVIGIFYAGFLEYDTKLAYVDYYQAQRFSDQGDSVFGVDVTLHDIYAARTVSKKIKEKLGPGPYQTVDWEKLNKSLFTALMMQKVVLTVVLAVIIGVAAFNIIATLVMMVFDKRREIAILKSMGATHGGIARIFLYVGTVVGLIGIAIGLSIGFGVCIFLRKVGWPLDPEVYMIDHLPVRLEAIDFVVTAAVAFLICVLATIVPSLSASKLRPVDGIRQE